MSVFQMELFQIHLFYVLVVIRIIVHGHIHLYIAIHTQLDTDFVILSQAAGPGTSTSQPPQPFYAPQGLPPGFHPSHFGNPLQAGVMAHVPPPSAAAQQGMQ